MKINIDKQRVPVRLGCTAEERAFPQIVEFDIFLELMGNPGANSDQLNDTIDYMQVAAIVEECCKAKEYNLLEHLAHTIALQTKDLSPLINKVTVLVTKQILPTASGIAVEVSV
jgi:dihydroneopterin aldolase